jgi:hypothetical protein
MGQELMIVTFVDDIYILLFSCCLLLSLSLENSEMFATVIIDTRII